jgi:hypothetical protein
MVGSSFKATPVNWLTCWRESTEFSKHIRVVLVRGKRAHVQVMRNVPLEAIHNRGRIVEVGANVGRYDIRTSASKVDPVPLDKLVLSPVIVVVLKREPMLELLAIS